MHKESDLGKNGMKHIILAGGGGTRLWPFSRSSLPKQFLHFGDKDSLLQKTIRRFYPQVAAKDILIVTNQIYFHLAKNQLTQIDPAFEKQILVEPEKKNTAPAIYLAVKYFQDILGADENDCFLVSSADHILSHAETLVATALKAKPIVQQGSHLVFGIRPHKPETGYGYIKTGLSQNNDLFKVEQFVEKPDYQTAQRYLLSGQYLWNAGIFLFQIKTFLEDLFVHCPEIHSLSQNSFQKTEENFSQMPDISIDYALLEKSSHLLVAPLDVSWSDVGSWDSIYDLFNKDCNQNVKVGNILDIDTKNCLIMGDKRLISTIGLENLLIVDTEDALFIGRKGQSQSVKHLVDEMKKRNVKESSEHSVSHRPWGTFSTVEEGEGYKIRHVMLEPEQSLSLQIHKHRNEYWIVIKGTAKVTIEDKELFVRENESIYVAKSQTHRLENQTKTRLELIEVQVGEYVGEDDVIRIEEAIQRP